MRLREKKCNFKTSYFKNAQQKDLQEDLEDASSDEDDEENMIEFE